MTKPNDHGNRTTDMSQRELATLYRDAGDVEPDSGLDWIVRARAAEASREARAPRRQPWLAGLVTASVAIVAIAVVLQQQSPPGRSLPETGSPLERRAPEALMAPSLDERRADQSIMESARKSSETREAQPHSPAPAQSFASEVAPEPASEDDAEMEMQQSRREHSMADRAGIAAESVRKVPEIPAGTAGNPDRMLDWIKMMIERGEIQRARELLGSFRREFPEHTVPESIERTLREEAADQ